MKRKLEVLFAHAMHISICQVVRIENHFKKYAFASLIGVSFMLPALLIVFMGGETKIGDML